MMTTTVKAVMTAVAPSGSVPKCVDKVSIIGAGSVGTAIAFSLLAQKITGELVLIDQDEALARGEMLDIQHATMYLGSPQISSSSDYEKARNSKICIITAGRRRLKDSQKLDAVKANVDIYKTIIPNIVNVAPACVLLICSYPVDIMTYVAYKLSKFEPHKVIGTGTVLESARFKVLVSQRLNVQPSSCQAYLIGEQGNNCVPVWSAVTVSGVRLRDVNPNLGTPEDPEDWQEIYQEVINSEEEVTRLKECGSWGLALSTARIVKAILHDTRDCIPVSTYVKGCRHGADKDIFLSLPCILGSSGVQSIVRMALSDSEKLQIQKSADRMNNVQRKLGLIDMDENFNCEDLETEPDAE